MAIFLKEYPSLSVLAGFLIVLVGMFLDAFAHLKQNHRLMYQLKANSLVIEKIINVFSVTPRSKGNW